MDINYLLALQNFSDTTGGFLADFMNKMTFLGDLNTLVVILAILYWCIDKDLGNYLIMGFEK